MNEVLNSIKTRRSFRSFKNEPIEKETLSAIVQAATQAPSGMNTQSWHFTVLTKQEDIALLYNALARELGKPGYNFYGATAFIICSDDANNTNGLANCACAMQNIMLAAHSLGVGSVWINQLKDGCKSFAIRDILDMFGVPSNHLVWGCSALGYPEGEAEAKELKEGTVHFVE